jgi:putative DNA primase/helicase
VSATNTEALDVLRGVGLEVDAIQWDAGLVRCGTRNKPRSTNGRYIAHSDIPASAWWCNFDEGTEGTWTAKADKKLTTRERTALAERAAANRATRDAEQAERHAAAAVRAQAIYAKAKPCAGHAYLERKGVKPVAGLKVALDGRLVVPVMNEAATISTVQFIDADGQKRFLSGGQKKSCFFAVGKDPQKPLIICEGVATALSLYEATGNPVLVAFDAGNLLPVSEMARAKYPDRIITIAADNDAGTDGNPGLTKATAAAIEINALLTVPQFKAGVGGTDFNDLHKAGGKDEVFRQFSLAKKPETPKEPLPAGFVIRTGGKMPGLWHVDIKDDGDPVETWIAALFEILGETRDTASSAWGLFLQWKDADGIVHRWAMPRALLAGRDCSAWRSVLADGGLRLGTSTRARNLLSAFLDTYSTARRVLCVGRTGWHGDGAAYVLPDVTLLSQLHKNRSDRSDSTSNINELSVSDQEKSRSDIQIVLQGVTEDNPFSVEGALEAWKATVGQWSRGNSRLALALCASLAGALLHVAGQESGGFHFVGKSSTGKTTALLAAASAWGRGALSDGFIKSWRSTDNGLEGIAALHSDALLCLDELGQASAKTVERASYMLGNERGKQRSRQDGGARTAKTWRVMFLSTGEIGLAAKLSEDGGRANAGQSVRMVDVSADAGAGLGIFEELHGHGSPQDFADAIRKASSRDYGHAARAFIQYLLDNMIAARESIALTLKEGMAILCPENADSEVRRVAKRFLLCAAAGEMAVEWGLLPWRQGEASQAVKACFDAWLDCRGGVGGAAETAIVGQVRLFIEQHGQSRFQDFEKPDSTVLNRAGFRKVENDMTVFLVLAESFKEVCHGYDIVRAARVLRDRGILLPGDGKNLAQYRSLPGMGRQRCYALTLGGNDASA